MTKKPRKAQINIDFLSGFFIFVMVVGYIAFAITGVFPKYAAQSYSNNLKLEAWQASENVMQATEKSGSIDTGTVGAFSMCYRYDYSNASSAGNYTRIKKILNISDLNSIHITLDTLFFGITDTGTGNSRNGSIVIRGVNYTVYVQKMATYFNETRNSTGSWSNESMVLGGEKYDVFKIDYDGDFVILKKRLIDCGPNPPLYSTNEVVQRYSVYNGSFAVVEMNYWL